MQSPKPGQQQFGDKDRSTPTRGHGLRVTFSDVSPRMMHLPRPEPTPPQVYNGPPDEDVADSYEEGIAAQAKTGNVELAITINRECKQMGESINKKQKIQRETLEKLGRYMNESTINLLTRLDEAQSAVDSKFAQEVTSVATYIQEMVAKIHTIAKELEEIRKHLSVLTNPLIQPQ